MHFYKKIGGSPSCGYPSSNLPKNITAIVNPPESDS